MNIATFGRHSLVEVKGLEERIKESEDDMSEKKWITRKCEDEDCIFVGYKGDDGAFVTIAMVIWYGEDDCNAEEDEVHANLIAAAPELLDACKNARILLSNVTIPMGINKQGTKINIIYEQIKAAINSAESQ
ncbi:hypothetical protein LCGC14_0346370 [marine sediment metagenome]|uniref:Uncharacterized protein n=1 Tax=marine sediment metagenome TaxID=412755 RepID=A0A0F9TCA2_9ZZZZ